MKKSLLLRMHHFEGSTHYLSKKLGIIRMIKSNQLCSQYLWENQVPQRCQNSNSTFQFKGGRDRRGPAAWDTGVWRPGLDIRLGLGWHSLIHTNTIIHYYMYYLYTHQHLNILKAKLTHFLAITIDYLF